MSPFLVFLYTIIGVAGAWALRQFVEKRGEKMNISGWVAYLVWYIAVVIGVAFTILNFDGRHSQAGTIGCVGTIIVAVLLGFVVYRLVCPKRRRA